MDPAIRFDSVCLALALAAAIPAARAEPPDGAAETAPRDAAVDTRSRGSVGLGVLVSDSEFAGEGSRVVAVPMFEMLGERWFVRGLDAGVVVFDHEGLTLDARIGARFDGWEADDLGRAELAARGVDRDALRDRDNGLDAGARLTWLGRLGRVHLDMRHDVTEGDAGAEISLGYTASMPLGRGLLVPGIELTHWTGRRADFIYGISDAEAARGAPAYSPGAIDTPKASLAYLRSWGRHWDLIAAVQYRRLPDAVTDSPLVARDTRGTATAFFSIARRF